MIRHASNHRSGQLLRNCNCFAWFRVLFGFGLIVAINGCTPIEQHDTSPAPHPETTTLIVTQPSADATLAAQLTADVERSTLEQQILEPIVEPTITPTYGPAIELNGIRFQPRGRVEALSVCNKPNVASLNAGVRISAWYFGNPIEDDSLVTVANIFNTYWDSVTGLGSIERFPGICTNDSLYLAGAAAISPDGRVVRPYFAPERQYGPNIAPQYGIYLPLEAFNQSGEWTLLVENEEVGIRIRIDIPGPQQPMFMHDINDDRIWLGGFEPSERAVLIVFDENGFVGDFRIQLGLDGTLLSTIEGVEATQGFVVVGESGNVALPNNLAGGTPAGDLLSSQYLLDLYWPSSTP